MVTPAITDSGCQLKQYCNTGVWIIGTIANYHTGRVDLIFEDYSDAYLERIWEHLLREEEWHVLRFYPLPEGSSTASGLRHLVDRNGLRMSIKKASSPPYLRIPYDYAKFLSKCSRSLRRGIRGAERLRADGKINVAFFTEAARVDEALTQIFAVSEKGWAADQGTAITSTRMNTRFPMGKPCTR